MPFAVPVQKKRKTATADDANLRTGLPDNFFQSVESIDRKIHLVRSTDTLQVPYIDVFITAGIQKTLRGVSGHTYPDIPFKIPDYLFKHSGPSYGWYSIALI